MLRLIAALVSCLAVVTVAGAAEPVAVAFPGRGPAAPMIKAQIFEPSGDGPFPAVVALHGCGGNTRPNGTFIPRVVDWTERWLAAGYAVVWPDSYGSRGLGPQCTVRDRSINPAMRAYDAMAAVDWLGTQARIDKAKIAMVGWSNGAGTALRAVEPRMAAASPDLRAVVAFYPGCRPIADARLEWRARVPVTILMGAADDWTPAEPCRRLAAASGIRYVEYAGAYHDFDAPDLPVRVRKNLTFTANGSGEAHVGTDPKARAAAILEVDALLKAAFR